MGGAQRVTSRLVNELQLDSHYHILMFSAEKSHSFFPLSIDVAFSKHPLRRIDMILYRIVEKFSLYVLNKKKDTYPKLSRIIDDFLSYVDKERPEIIVLQEQFILIVDEIKERFKDIKIVYWAHNNIDMLCEKYFVESQEIMLSSFSKCDAVISLTDYDKYKIKKYTNNSYRIYNPLTMDLANHYSQLNQKTICFVGRIDIPHKGIDFLVQIASDLPENWKIAVAGNGNIFSMYKFRKLVKKYNAKSKIDFLGSLHDEDLSNHYLNCSFFLHTSRWEGFPLVLMEAMNYGLPIVAFANTGSSEALDYGNFGILVKNGDIKVIMKEINKLLVNNDLLREYQKKSLERVSSFSIEKIALEWKNIFEIL